jgi:hypothetical protein
MMPRLTKKIKTQISTPARLASSSNRRCDCQFCLLFPLEVTCSLLRLAKPTTVKDLFIFASVSPCFREILQDMDEVEVDLGKRFQEQCIRGMDDKLKEKIEHMLHCLHNNFPRLALITFTIPVPIINDSSSSGDLKGHWTAPSLYGRLVTASLRGRWQDQGWGNQKGSLIYHCHDRDTGCLVLAVKGVAPHQEEPFEGVVGPSDWTDHQFIGGTCVWERGDEEVEKSGGVVVKGKQQNDGYKLNICYNVGGGGGHALYVSDLSLTIALSPREWHTWMDEQIDKLTHKGGWAWCIDGGHPSARFYLESNGTAWFEEWNGPNPSADELSKGIPAAVCEDVFKNLRSEKTNLLRFSSTNRLDWSFQPLARCVVLRSLSDSDVLYYLYVDPGYDEFYVHSPRGTGYLRGSCGFNLGNDLPERYKYCSNGFTTPCFPQHAISSGSNDKIGRRLVLSGIALLDPFESSRRYSSIWNRDAPGTGLAQSTLGSPLAWCAGHHRAGEWLEMQVAPLKENRRILGLVVQKRRAFTSSTQCVRKIQVTFRKQPDSLCDLAYQPTFEVGFGNVLFNEPVRGRYFRILPTRWNSHISMRAGILIGHGTQLSLLNPGEGQRTYSSVWDNEPQGVGHAQSMINSPRAWSAGVLDKHQWMVIDAGSVIEAMGLKVQHRVDEYHQAVTAWRVESKVNLDDEWQAVDQGSVFTNDPNETRFLWFDAAVEANTVRVNVLEWEEHIALRCGVVLAPDTTHALPFRGLEK